MDSRGKNSEKWVKMSQCGNNVEKNYTFEVEHTATINLGFFLHYFFAFFSIVRVIQAVEIRLIFYLIAKGPSILNISSASSTTFQLLQ